MSFTVDGTSGLTFPNSTTQASAGGMTLLGTITPTSANSISISGLNLTNYKQLNIVVNNLSTTSTADDVFMSSNNSQTVGYIGTFSSTSKIGRAHV